MSLGAGRVVESLEALGVTVVFGLPGVHNLPIWRALRESGIRLIGVRHEQAAVYAADGYARATGRLGVALVTTGPGAANTLGATGEAFASGSPVLVIATDIPARLRRPGVYRGVLHETRDQAAMFAPVTRAASVVDSPDAIAGAVFTGAAQALAAPSGPVYLGVPTDFLSSAVGDGRSGAAPTAADPVTAATAVEPGALTDAVARLQAARRPLIWAGGGAARGEAGEAVAMLAEALVAPVITTYGGRGLLAPAHPCAVSGPVHHPAVGALWDDADVVVAVGSDFDGMMTQNWAMPAPPELIAVNVDAADATKNYDATVVLEGDAATVCAALAAAVASVGDGGSRAPEAGGGDRLEALRADLARVGATVAASVAADEPLAAEMLAAFERVLPPEAVVVADMCIPGYWLAGFRRVPAPRRLAYPVGWGTLGFAFPASIGSALAGTGPAVCVAGDGGFLFACGELATIREAGVPVTIVLVDDGGYGMLRFDQSEAGETPFGVDLVGPDFVALAQSFGVAACRVEGFGSAFEIALDEAVGADEPRMVVVDARMKPPVTTSPRWYRRH